MPLPPSFGLGRSKPFTPYEKGDEFKPSAFAREDQARLQLALRDAGLFTKSERFQLGTWDQNTRNAYKRLLEYANGAGMDWQTALRQYSAARQQFGDTGGSGDGSGSGVRAPLAVRVSNPAELAETFESTFRTRTGRRPSSEVLQRMVNAYLAQEAGQQKAAYNVAETGGAVTDVVDPKLFAQQQAESEDPTGSFRQDAIGVFGELGAILRGEDSGGY
ncbi:MAG TPA: hypothetical protein VMZ71_02025 [Gemmataceae bacterium]|nr:hypothetical protein [Gemmataceae bacterium]